MPRAVPAPVAATLLPAAAIVAPVVAAIIGAHIPTVVAPVIGPIVAPVVTAVIGPIVAPVVTAVIGPVALPPIAALLDAAPVKTAVALPALLLVGKRRPRQHHPGNPREPQNTHDTLPCTARFGAWPTDALIRLNAL